MGLSLSGNNVHASSHKSMSLIGWVDECSRPATPVQVDVHIDRRNAETAFHFFLLLSDHRIIQLLSQLSELGGIRFLLYRFDDLVPRVHGYGRLLPKTERSFFDTFRQRFAARQHAPRDLLDAKV